jgi:hypothetical protein
LLASAATIPIGATSSNEEVTLDWETACVFRSNRSGGHAEAGTDCSKVSARGANPAPVYTILTHGE